MPRGPRALWRTFGVRLNLWYLLVFAGALVGGSLMADVVVRSAIAADQRDRVHAALVETRRRIEAVGAGALSADHLRGDAWVRLFDPESGPVFEHVPRGESAPELPVPAPEGEDVQHARSATGAAWSVASTTVTRGLVLEVGLDDRELQVALDRLRSANLIVVATAMALALLGGLIVTWRGRRPLSALRDTTEHILASGDLSRRVPPRGGAVELVQLGKLFNTVLDRNERLVTTTREALDAVAHDLRTPLTRLRSRAELALADPAVGAAGRDALADCVEESDRVLQMLASLMDLAEAEAGAMRLERAAVPVAEVAADVVDLYEMVAADAGVALTADVARDLTVRGDRTRLRQALANLVDNAIKYTPAGGSVRVTAEAVGTEVAVTVSDDGVGVAPEEQERIWERLYRADRARSRQGLGLGLAMVRAIAVAHGGAVAVASAPGEGARFTLTLPAA